MTSFSDNIRNTFRTQDTLQRLLIINVVVFLAINITAAVMKLFMISMDDYVNITRWLAVPASVNTLITRPWTIITYMFLHQEFFHILFNMLWLYWMGKILQEYLGNKKLLSTYILGGISGAVLYIIAFNVFPLFSNSVDASYALGASASVLAITVAAATLLPEYPVNIFLLGTIPLKYVAIVTILLDLVNISGNNAGGHIAHIGGALFGFVYIKQMRAGRDLGSGFNKMMDKLSSIFSSNPLKMKVKYRRSSSTDDAFIANKKARQERTDEILDKISKSGYGSLTKDEKDFLFKSSKEE